MCCIDGFEFWLVVLLGLAAIGVLIAAGCVLAWFWGRSLVPHLARAGVPPWLTLSLGACLLLVAFLLLFETTDGHWQTPLGVVVLGGFVMLAGAVTGDRRHASAGKATP